MGALKSGHHPERPGFSDPRPDGVEVEVLSGTLLAHAVSFHEYPDALAVVVDHASLPTAPPSVSGNRVLEPVREQGFWVEFCDRVEEFTIH